MLFILGTAKGSDKGAGLGFVAAPVTRVKHGVCHHRARAQLWDRPCSKGQTTEDYSLLRCLSEPIYQGPFANTKSRSELLLQGFVCACLLKKSSRDRYFLSLVFNEGRQQSQSIFFSLFNLTETTEGRSSIKTAPVSSAPSSKGKKQLVLREQNSSPSNFK